MNARITPTDKVGRLTDYQFRLIIKIATRQEPICVRADMLKGLSYCTDDVKFEVLKKSRKVDDDTYNALYNLYFGVVEKDDDKPEPEPKKSKGGRPSSWDEADILTLIHYYNKDYKASVLANMFHKSEQQIYSKIYDLKKSKKYKEMFKMPKEKAAPKPQEQKFEEIIQSVDAGSRKEMPEPNTMPKAFTATGKGFMSTEGGLKLDEEPITTILRQEIVKKGLAQFYAEVEITIRPVAPVGMVVAVEE